MLYHTRNAAKCIPLLKKPGKGWQLYVCHALTFETHESKIKPNYRQFLESKRMNQLSGGGRRKKRGQGIGGDLPQ